MQAVQLANNNANEATVTANGLILNEQGSQVLNSGRKESNRYDMPRHENEEDGPAFVVTSDQMIESDTSQGH